MKAAALAILFSVLSQSALAAATHGPEAQVYIAFQLVENGESIAGGSLVASPEGGFTAIGGENHLPRLSCSGSTRKLDSVSLFSGVTFSARTENDTVLLQVARFATPSTAQAVSSVPTNECIQVTPQQVQLLSESVIVPLRPTEKMVASPLPDGYELQYQIIGTVD